MYVLLFKIKFHTLKIDKDTSIVRCHRGDDGTVVGFITTYAMSAYHH